jgi:hypothetical protein
MNSNTNLSRQGKSKRQNRKPKRTNQQISSRPQYDAMKGISQKQVVVKELGGFPNAYKWRYSITAVQPIPVNGTAVSSGITFALNAPSVRSGLGWATLSNVYDEYIVTAADVRVDFVNKSTTVPYRVNMSPYDDDINVSFIPTTDTLFVQSPLSQTKTMATVSGSPSTVTLSRRWTVQEMAGLNKPADQFADLLTGYVGGTFSSHVFSAPTNIWSVYVSCTTCDGSAHLANVVYANVYILYEFTFFSRLSGAAY